MSLLFCDSFDSTAASTDILDRWDAAPSAGGFGLTVGRNGGPALERNDGNVPPAIKHLPAAYAQPAGGAALFVTSSIRLPVYPPTNTVRGLYYLCNERAVAQSNTDSSNRSSALTTIGLQVSSAGLLQVQRNGSTFPGWTGTTVLALNTWYRIEMKIANVDDTGGIIEVRVNGVTDINLTNADIWQSGPKEIVSVQVGVAAARQDDVIIMDSTGTAFNGFLGDLLIETIRPNGAGTTTQSTPNTGTAWQAVDEVAADFDTTYTAITTVNNFDTYAYGNMVSTPTTIHGVVVSTQAQSPGMTPRKIRNVAKLSETSLLGAEKSVILDLTAFYRMEQDVFPLKPGGGAWTKTDVDAAEFGWQVTQ